MSSGTYIGQAQIETQVEYEDYEVGDVVVFKSGGTSVKYLVEGFDDDKVILRAMEKHTWKPNRNWFVKVAL